jgi:hypothetical protein
MSRESLLILREPFSAGLKNLSDMKVCRLMNFSEFQTACHEETLSRARSPPHFGLCTTFQGSSSGFGRLFSAKFTKREISYPKMWLRAETSQVLFLRSSGPLTVGPSLSSHDA